MAVWGKVKDQTTKQKGSSEANTVRFIKSKRPAWLDYIERLDDEKMPGIASWKNEQKEETWKAKEEMDARLEEEIRTMGVGGWWVRLQSRLEVHRKGNQSSPWVLQPRK